MSREFKVWQLVLVLLFTLSSSTYHSNGKLILEGSASFDSSGFTKLTNTTKHSYGQVFNSNPVSFKNSSFNFHFHFGIVPEHNHSGSHGMACVLSPTRHLPGASSDQSLQENLSVAREKGIAIPLQIAYCNIFASKHFPLQIASRKLKPLAKRSHICNGKSFLANLQRNFFRCKFATELISSQICN
ncbi:Concanavalin A-like lectin/glucanase domain protein [Raphanus sativus]|nr:Concanavalin A-like lectin/glucanase domain protein [Raphanus sativus]